MKPKSPTLAMDFPNGSMERWVAELEVSVVILAYHRADAGGFL